MGRIIGQKNVSYRYQGSTGYGYVTVLRDCGLPMATLFVELLEPTTRYLGEMWEREECDFIDATLGVARPQKLFDPAASNVP